MRPVSLLVFAVACGPRVIVPIVDCDEGPTNLRITIDGVPDSVSWTSEHPVTIASQQGRTTVATVPLTALPPDTEHEVVLEVPDPSIHAIASCRVARSARTPSLAPPPGLTDAERAAGWTIELVRDDVEPALGEVPKAYTMPVRQADSGHLLEVGALNVVRAQTGSTPLLVEGGKLVLVPMDPDATGWTPVDAWSIDGVHRRWRLRRAPDLAAVRSAEARFRTFRRTHQAAWAAPLGDGPGRPTAVLTDLGLRFLHCENCLTHVEDVEVIATLDVEHVPAEACAYSDGDGRELTLHRFTRTAEVKRWAARSGDALDTRTFTSEDAPCPVLRKALFKGTEHVDAIEDLAEVRPVRGEAMAWLRDR